MNLIVDIGNTSTKLAIYDKGQKLFTRRLEESGSGELETELTNHSIEKVIISSVKKIPAAMTSLLTAKIPYVHILTYKSKLPFKIEYKTPATLGPDRIAGAAGAYNLFPESEILIIDSGSAITYDYLSAGIYKGGNISPGLNMRFKALNKFTGKLPLLTPARSFTDPGQNTADAILAGVITGVTYEINEYIRTFEKKSSDFKIIFTGGDSAFLKDKINHQFTYMPDIVIDGLNYILEYNAI